MISDLLPPVRDRMNQAIQIANMLGFAPRVTSSYRSISQQATLRRQYESCIANGQIVSPTNADPTCRYPANAPGDSAHNFGLAFDSVVPDGYWDAWTELRAFLGFRVPDNDRVHAEVPDWRSIAALMISLGWVDMAGSLNVALGAPHSPVAPRSTPTPVSTPPAQLPPAYVTGPEQVCQSFRASHPGYRVFCNGVPMG